MQMLALARDLRDLCAGSSFPAEGDPERLAELLARREKLIKQAVAWQGEAPFWEKSLRKSRDRDQDRLREDHLPAPERAAGQNPDFNLSPPVARFSEQGFLSSPDQPAAGDLSTVVPGVPGHSFSSSPARPAERNISAVPGRGFSSPPDQSSAASRRLEPLLEEIVALDAASGRILERLLQQTAGEMEKIQKGKKANKAYRDHDYQFEGFFVDSNK